MYESYYGLVRRPFEMAPDPAFLYLGEAHREGLATLVYAVRARKGFALLTGEVGTGKTTLLHALLAQLDSSALSAFIFNPRVEPLDFFRLLFDELGVEGSYTTKAEYLLALNRFLIERLERDEPTLLIVDEAQNLSSEMLEEIRLLSNLETSRSKLLHILLVGQPELWEMLRRPELRQLRQRIVLRHRLWPFDADETAAYVEERLRLAGHTGKDLFKRSALREVHARSGGVPRLINTLCDGALLLGYARELARIGPEAVREVAGDLGLEEEAPAADDGDTRPLGRRRGGGLRGLLGGRRRRTA